MAMKKVLIALGLLAFCYTGTNAQTTTACGTSKGYVCRSHDGNAKCYQTKYAQNFPVCKGPNGYYVCCTKDAAEAKDVEEAINEEPVAEARTVVCERSERSGNIVACYETRRAYTNTPLPIRTD